MQTFGKFSGFEIVASCKDAQLEADVTTQWSGFDTVKVNKRFSIVNFFNSATGFATCAISVSWNVQSFYVSANFQIVHTSIARGTR